VDFFFYFWLKNKKNIFIFFFVIIGGEKKKKKKKKGNNKGEGELEKKKPSEKSRLSDCRSKRAKVVYFVNLSKTNNKNHKINQFS